MENLFVLNPISSSLDIRDGIDDRIIKLKSLIGALLLAVGCLNEDMMINIETVYNNLRIIDSIIDELEELFFKLESFE